MKSLVFDTGPIISLTINNLLWVLEHMKTRFKGDFIIPIAVKKELIDKPFSTKKFKFEALQVMQQIRRDTFHVYDDNELHSKALQLMDLANHCFEVHGNLLNIVHYAEMQAVACTKMLHAEGVVVDERTTRELIERPDRLEKLLSNRLHAKVTSNKKNLKKLKEMLKGIKVIRSVELISVAYEIGMLDEFKPHLSKDVPDPRKALLSALLWGLKLNGCAISRKEIEQIINIERKRR